MAGILVGSLLGICIYFWLVFLSPWTVLVIQVSAFAAVAALLAIVAWIGYTLATTPPPKPIEELEKELEAIKETLKRFIQGLRHRGGWKGSHSPTWHRAPSRFS